MNHTVLSADHKTAAYRGKSGPTVGFLISLIWWSAGALAQSPSQPSNLTAPFSARATHLMGFEGSQKNTNGTLSIHDNVLQFQKDGKPPVEIKIAAVQNVFLGEQSKQVGGLPMTLGKAAAPYGGGRVVSLFAHKKYDTLTLEYVDGDGGVHGAIFQLNKGQGHVLRTDLVSRGAHVSGSEDESKQQTTAEVSDESK